MRTANSVIHIQHDIRVQQAPTNAPFFPHARWLGWRSIQSVPHTHQNKNLSYPSVRDVLCRRQCHHGPTNDCRWPTKDGVSLQRSVRMLQDAGIEIKHWSKIHHTRKLHQGVLASNDNSLNTLSTSHTLKVSFWRATPVRKKLGDQVRASNSSIVSFNDMLNIRIKIILFRAISLLTQHFDSRDVKHLECLENLKLRQTIGIRWENNLTNNDVLPGVSLPSVDDNIFHRRLR